MVDPVDLFFMRVTRQFVVQLFDYPNGIDSFIWCSPVIGAVPEPSILGFAGAAATVLLFRFKLTQK